MTTEAGKQMIEWIAAVERVDDPAGNTIYDEVRLEFLPRIEAEAAAECFALAEKAILETAAVERSRLRREVVELPKRGKRNVAGGFHVNRAAVLRILDSPPTRGQRLTGEDAETEPRTEAGKRLLDWFGGPMRRGEKHNLSSAIAAIEAEATTAAEQRLIEGSVPAEGTWPTREDFRRMSSVEVNAFFASIGSDWRVADFPAPSPPRDPAPDVPPGGTGA